MSYIESPNLPSKEVKAVLISSEAGAEVFRILEKRGVEAISVPRCPDIAPEVSSHPDMIFHHLGDNKMIYYKGAAEPVCRRLEELGFELSESSAKLEAKYPKDIALNAARVGNYLFCNEKYTEKTVLEFCGNNKIHIINVKQGYAKCSVCVVDSNSIITADKSIASAATEYGLQALLISPGSISLPGYNYGFIGGCCGKIARNKIMFCGDITSHPDYKKIKDFLSKRNVEIEILGSGPLFDIGSIIPLIEED